MHLAFSSVYKNGSPELAEHSQIVKAGSRLVGGKLFFIGLISTSWIELRENQQHHPPTFTGM